MSTAYEIIIIEDKNCGEVIIFRSNHLLADSNEIVTEAIRKGFIGDGSRKYVRIARGYIEYEYEHIGKRRSLGNGK